ncbi:MAG TPA: hypothetical protein VHG93_14745 [Longimicrobium sp.]|nr:hypothetical protein [Longimicrobium sp.]
MDRGAKGAVRLRLEGRSSAKGGFPPAWVNDAAAFRMAGFHRGTPGIELRIPSLLEALPQRFVQADLFPPVDASDSALTLMGRSLDEALSGNEDSDAYDPPLLRSFEGFREVFRHGVEAVEIRNGRADRPSLTVTPEGIQTVRRLHRQTPRSQRVRIAGKVDAIRHSDRAFTLVLQSGEQIRGVLADGEPEVLAPFFGRVAAVSGVAQFRPSGSLLRVDADLLQLADDQDLALWSDLPRPVFAPTDFREMRRLQGPRSGINAVIGAWPGDETDEEIAAMLEEMS